jgi:hypothetical protein
MLLTLLLPGLVLAGDPYAYCDAENADETLLLLDLSQSASADNLRVLLKGIKQLRRTMDTGDRLEVYAMGQDSGRTLGTYCQPGCMTEGFLECEPLRVRKDKQKLEKKLFRNVIGVFKEQRSRQPPNILKGLRQVSAPTKSDSPYKRVVVYSRMIHRDDQFDLSRAEDDFDELFFDAVMQERIPNLKDIDLRVFGYDHLNTDETKLEDNFRIALEQFWDDVFVVSGAKRPVELRRALQ